ncbi:MAG: phosphoglucomutase/phosphomannomutase family protein [Chloroflexi bacterium]|nr:phosphoglucomutase/phosphomannomutase family protein [Chloroflexota bacterium]
MPRTIVFGTDGWRALIAEEFTFANVRLCAQGVADYLAATGQAPRGLVVGYDTRFASEHFAAAAAEVVAANGIPVWLADRAAPTPTVSYNIVHRKAAGAIIITASHNPAAWNGFKYKPEYAGSASPEVVAALEERIERAAQGAGPKRLPWLEAEKRGLAHHIDVKSPYIEHIRRLVDVEGIRQAGLRIAIDPMYGAGAGYLSGLLAGGKTEVVEIHGERNPLFPGMERPEPIAHNLRELRDEVLRRGFDVGLATDGDADRVGGVDDQGAFFTPLQLFSLIAFYFLEVRKERGPLVMSMTMSNMVRRLGERYGVRVYETPVGFKYLGPKMMETHALLAGEESGGFGFRGHIPERDGILSALYLLDMMAMTGKKASQLLPWLFQTVGPHYYDRWDLEFDAAQRETIVARVRGARPGTLAGKAVEGMTDVDGFRYDLAGGSWLCLRFSGTEPLIRIYAEAESPDRVREILQAGRSLLGV